MGFITITFKLLVLLAVAKVLVVSPNLRQLVSLYWHDAAPRVIETFLGIYDKIRGYCPEEVMQDFLRTANFTVKGFQLVLSLAAWAQPAAARLSNLFAETVGSLHDKCMAHTADFLRQLLGVEVIMLSDEVGDTKSKFLSGLLFIVWLLLGLVAISKLSFKKCLAWMSAAFLLHAYFGPVWCLRRLAFLFGLILWMGSVASSRPVPAAIAVLVMLILSRMLAHKKKMDEPRVQECKNNNEDRIERLDRKMDLLLTKMEHITKKLEMLEKIV